MLQTESEQIGALLAEAEAPIDRISTRRNLDFLRWRYSTASVREKMFALVPRSTVAWLETAHEALLEAQGPAAPPDSPHQPAARGRRHWPSVTSRSPKRL